MVDLWKVEDNKILFPKPLLEARIVDRPNRFIVNCEVNGEIVRCHCPTTGSVGGMVLNGLSCLVSGPYVGGRSTAYTLEAIAVEPKDSPNFQWIGVNQSQVNRYVEAALASGLLAEVPEFSHIETLKREPRLGGSRLDFLVNGKVYVEVKMPLKQLQVEIPAEIPRKPLAPTTVERMLRQVEDITEALGLGEEALMLTVFCYDAPLFRPIGNKTPLSTKISATMAAAGEAGMERWQLNLKVEPTHVEILKLVNLTAPAAVR